MMRSQAAVVARPAVSRLLLLVWFVPRLAPAAPVSEAPAALVLLTDIFKAPAAPVSDGSSVAAPNSSIPSGQDAPAKEELPMSRFVDGARDIPENGTVRTPETLAAGMGDLFDEMRFSVIRIQSVVADTDIFRPYVKLGDKMSVGSGFAVEDGDKGPVFLTNAHVVRDAHSVQVQLPALGQMFFEASVPIICNELDLAVVQLVKPDHFSAELAAHNVSLRPIHVQNSPVHMGMEVAAIGFPLGSRSLKLSRGIISGTEQVENSICYQSTAPISPGNSGGPLLSLDGGHVVGVNFASSSSGSAQNINFVVPALHVLQVLREFRRVPKPMLAEGGASAAASPTTSPMLRGGLSTSAEGYPSANGEAMASTGSGSRHTVFQLAPVEALSMEANDALYNGSGGCSTGVFLSEIPPWSALRSADPPVPQRSFLVSVENSTLDSYGMGYAPGFLNDPVPFRSLFQLHEDVDQVVNFTTCKGGKKTTHGLSMRWLPKYKLGVHTVEEPHFTPQELDFECFAGLTIMQMSLNHVAMILEKGGSLTLGRWMLPENQVKPRLIVTHVTKGSYANRVLAAGMVVRRVNGAKVSTLKDLRQSFVPSKKDMWTLETDRGLLYAVNFKKEVENQLKEASASMSSRYLLTTSLQAAAADLGLKGLDVATKEDVNATVRQIPAKMAAVVADAKRAVQALESAVNNSIGEAAGAQAQLASASAALESAANAVAAINRTTVRHGVVL